MTDNVIELVDHEEAVYRARLAGKSPRRIAREFGLSVASVEKIIEEHAPVLSNEYRKLTLQLELERLDSMQSVYYERAVDGDTQAAAIMIKLQERRASYLALDCGVRVDPRPLPNEQSDGPCPGSHEQLIQALEAIATEKQQHQKPNLQLVPPSPDEADPPAS
jgi:hypothetical protein